MRARQISYALCGCPSNPPCLPALVVWHIGEGFRAFPMTFKIIELGRIWMPAPIYPNLVIELWENYGEKWKKNYFSDLRTSFRDRYSMAREGNCYRRSQPTYTCSANYYLQSTRPLVNFYFPPIAPENKKNKRSRYIKLNTSFLHPKDSNSQS